MNREIKFRLYNKLENKIEYLGCNLFTHLQPNDYELQQYTGLKDKNGKDIYEGDILDSDYGKPFEVKFHKGGFGHLELNLNDKYWNAKKNRFEPRQYSIYGGLRSTKEWFRFWPLIDAGFSYGPIERLDTVVLGNIYENPELLPKGDPFRGYDYEETLDNPKLQNLMES